MNETKFTPGPWRIEENGETNIYAGSKLVARTFTVYGKAQPGDHFKPVEEGAREANATLIAAAPELHAALQRIVETGFSIQAEEQAHAALTKARGE